MHNIQHEIGLWSHARRGGRTPLLGKPIKVYLSAQLGATAAA
jgi:hypothetical protein